MSAPNNTPSGSTSTLVGLQELDLGNPSVELPKQVVEPQSEVSGEMMDLMDKSDSLHTCAMEMFEVSISTVMYRLTYAP